MDKTAPDIAHEISVIDKDGCETKSVLRGWEWGSETEDEVRLCLLMRDRQYEARSSRGYFHAFQQIRRELERDGLFAYCFASSRDVYSPKVDSMIPVDMAYKTSMGRQALQKDLVYMFASDPTVIPSTVDEQEGFHEAWLSSLG